MTTHRIELRASRTLRCAELGVLSLFGALIVWQHPWESLADVIGGAVLLLVPVIGLVSAVRRVVGGQGVWA